MHQYRPEIDGLRAISVLPVVFYHAGFSWFSGGFVGVDIFFVISGFLITKILLIDLQRDNFNIGEFYKRRILRILPLYFLVTFTCIPFAVTLMLPSQFLDFSQSVLASAIFVSNILFWLESGYFAAAAEIKPLLHTWSLSVEEQFYLFFPWLLLLVHKYSDSVMSKSIVMIVLFAVSLLLSEMGWRNYPDANFYLIIGRIWELLAGALAAVYTEKKGIKRNNLLSIFGIFLIICSMVFFNKDLPTPSLYLLPCVMGAVLILICCDKHTLVGQVLSCKLFVFIGLISFSIYLWHQPIFAFWRLLDFVELYKIDYVLLIILCLLLSYFSWRYVEKPCRQGFKTATAQVYLFAVAGTSILFLAGTLMMKNVPVIYGISQKDIDSVTNRFLTHDNYNYALRNSVLNKKTELSESWVFIGDSNMGDFMNAIMESNLIDNIDITYWKPEESCTEGDVFEGLYKTPKCLVQNKSRALRDELQKAQKIFIGIDWNLDQMETISLIQANLRHEFGDKLYAVGSKWTNFSRIDYEYLYLENVSILPSVVRAKEESQIINKKLKEIFGNNFIDPFVWLCEGQDCMIRAEGETEVLQYDGFHLTKAGAMSWGGILKHTFEGQD